MLFLFLLKYSQSLSMPEPHLSIDFPTVCKEGGKPTDSEPGGGWGGWVGGGGQE